MVSYHKRPKKSRLSRLSKSAPIPVKTEFFEADFSARFFFRHFFTPVRIGLILSKLNLLIFLSFGHMCRTFLCTMTNSTGNFLSYFLEVSLNYLSKFFQKARKVKIPQTFVQLTQNMNVFFYISKIAFSSHFTSKIKIYTDFCSDTL